MTSNPLPTVQVQVDIPKKEIHKRLFSKRLEELDEGKTGTNQRGKISSQLNCDVDDADCDDDDADCDDDDADCDDDDADCDDDDEIDWQSFDNLQFRYDPTLMTTKQF